MYVLTDGEENDSRNRPETLLRKIQGLAENWTIAAFVPNQQGVFEAKKFGFPKENVAVWDTVGDDGLSEAGEKIRKTTDQFMKNRTLGIRGTKNLFTMNIPSVSTISKNLSALHPGQYRMLRVNRTSRIDEFVESELSRRYVRGEAYYELTKREIIQPQKEIAILYKSMVYVGDEARRLLGLPDYKVEVKPEDHTKYKIYVQSTSNNRKLVEGTQLLILS